MTLRIRLLPLKENPTAEIASYDTPLIPVIHNGEQRFGTLEETYGEGSAEGESWKPVEIY